MRDTPEEKRRVDSEVFFEGFERFDWIPPQKDCSWFVNLPYFIQVILESTQAKNLSVLSNKSNTSTQQSTISLRISVRRQTHISAKSTLSHLPSRGQGSLGLGAWTSLAIAARGTPRRTLSSTSGGRFLSALARTADVT